jgi:hypothetical protein
MTSEECKEQQCPYFDKVSGKAVCKYRRLTNGAKKEYIKHITQCPKRNKYDRD